MPTSSFGCGNPLGGKQPKANRRCASGAVSAISELAGKHSLHANQSSQWKRQLLEEGPDVFAGNGSQDHHTQEAMQAELYEQIGRLKMELAP